MCPHVDSTHETRTPAMWQSCRLPPNKRFVDELISRASQPREAVVGGTITFAATNSKSMVILCFALGESSLT